MYNKIKCLNDAKQLQEDLNNIFILCNNNGMILNIDKYATVSFSQRKKKYIIFRNKHFGLQNSAVRIIEMDQMYLNQ